MKKEMKYTKVASHEAKKWEFKKCILLYSGWLDTSVMLKWIQEEYECEVIALTINIGQTADNLIKIKKKALTLGAKDAIVYDAKDEFADILLSQTIKANADYQGWYALSTPLWRVIISKIAVKIAKKYDCSVIAHWCTGKWNDQVRFEWYMTTLNPKIKIIAPVREWWMWRQEEIEYAKKHNIDIIQKTDKPYSYDENMWWNTWEGWEIEDPELIPPLKNILQRCNTPIDAPNKEEVINISFEQWIPVWINNKKMKLSDIIHYCNSVGWKHWVGIFNLIEDRFVWLKVRWIYENPWASILISAHKKLEQLVSTREENEMKTFIDNKRAYITYAAKRYNPVMSHLNSYINNHNKKVTGNVKVKLYKWNIMIVALESKYSLFDQKLATFEKDDTFNQNSAAWFIEIYNLSQKTAFNTYNFEEKK